MPQHTRPEILRSIRATISAVRPTCHLCSWTWDLKEATFRLLRPSWSCLEHRDLFGEDASPPGGLLMPFTGAA
jgi:hypothetical protein